MKVVVPREVVAGEKRVALVPETVGRLIKDGHSISVEAGAGHRAGFTDQTYIDAGATIVGDPVALLGNADLVVKVGRPAWREEQGCNEASLIREGAALISFMQLAGDPLLVPLLIERRLAVFAMERVPRITRAQYMDALSSQSTAAGYRAALLAAGHLGKFFPMLMTAAGTIPPAKVLVIGAGVAGLQAIATCRRLGAVIEAFDTRPVVKEQVQSLGAKFVELGVDHGDAQDAGGYARELGEDHLRRERELIHQRAAAADAVITTALVPGKHAPVLIDEATVKSMRPGSVIIDLAAEQGGNCELSVPGKTVVRHDVTIVAPLHITSEVAFHASQMYSRNLAAVVKHLAPAGALVIDMNDEITRAMCVTLDGQAFGDAAQTQPSAPVRETATV